MQTTVRSFLVCHMREQLLINEDEEKHHYDIDHGDLHGGDGEDYDHDHGDHGGQGGGDKEVLFLATAKLFQLAITHCSFSEIVSQQKATGYLFGNIS